MTYKYIKDNTLQTGLSKRQKITQKKEERLNILKEK